MASLERLFKAFEVLKLHQSNYGDETFRKKESLVQTKKEKITNCVTIAESVCSTALRSVPDFPKFLGIALETFLACCDDPDSDVRMVADECLSRTIKTLLDTNLGRIQVELYKEIKKNGAQRSLRVALYRFSDLCHLIRPQKCRPYICNILPPLIQVAKRPEESVQETLAQVVPKIFQVLGKFTLDLEMKALLKAFYPNLKSNTAVVRRTAASCLNVICQHSRQPNTAYAWLLGTLLDSLIPVSPTSNISSVLGILLCIRHMIPNLSTQCLSFEEKALQGAFCSKTTKHDASISVEKLVQVYELLLHFLQHCDHNVVTAAMEALQQLLRLPPPSLLSVLLSPEGIHCTRIHLGDMECFRGSSAASDLGSVASLVPDELPLEDDTDCSQGGLSAPEDCDDRIGNEDASPFERRQSPIKSLSYASIGGDDNSENASYRFESTASLQHMDSLSSFCQPKVNYAVLCLEKPDGEQYEISGQESPSSEQNLFVAATRLENIGNFTDAEVPLVFCARLLCASFLLDPVKNTLKPDIAVRVSVKTLALGCLSGIAGIYPRVMLLPLGVNEDQSSPDNPTVADIFLYANHSDPQVRGTTALVTGSFIKGALCEGKGNFQKWLTACASDGAITLQRLTAILMETSDGAAVATKLALVALKMCLVPIFNSTEGHLGLKIVKTMLRLPSNNYWLVKVELLELLPEIPFNVVKFLEGSVDSHHKDMSDSRGLQSEIMNNVVLVLLGDEDYRVRYAATVAICRLVPRMFFPLDHHNQDPLIAIAREHTNNFLDPILHDSTFPSHSPILGIMSPYDNLSTKPSNSVVESSLSRMLHFLVKAMSSSANKYLTVGCLHAISVLSKEYLVTTYPAAWSCVLSIDWPHTSVFPGKNSTSKHTPATPPSERITFSVMDGGSLAAVVMSLLSSSSIATDLLAQQHGVQLLGNLFAGAAVKCLQMQKKSRADSPVEEEAPWSMLIDCYTITLAKNLLVHLIRMLNVCVHVMEDQQPSAPQLKASLPSLPNTSSLSPIKRKSKSSADTLSHPAGVPTALHTSNKSSPSKSASAGEKEEKSSRTSGHASNAFGAFYSLSHYMKIYEALKGTYSNYKISLDAQSGEKFISLVRTLLHVLGQLLEIATVTEIGQHADELLGYLKLLIVLEPCTTILCVQQLLKSLFGTNVTSQFESQAHVTDMKPGHATRLNVPAVAAGFFHYCLGAPYAQLTQTLNGGPFHLAMSSSDSKSGSSNWLGWIKNKWERKSPVLSKVIAGKGDKAQLSSYIRLFEPLVIKALKQYTITSSVELQCQVLQILSQLVQLRVNYCLLDSDQIFIGFVIKQFEYIEEGQIPQSEKLIPRIFHFLVLLSYERYHSKSIIGVPKIIHLCDGLMASGQPPATFAIPALLPVVEDLFLVRGILYKSDAGKELDTQREVVISMLLKLIHYHQVLDMFVVILQQSRKDCEEKWKKLSRQVVDILLPLLQKLQVNIDNQESLDILHQLLETVTPSVFRPVDVPLKILLSPPCDLNSPKLMQRWLGLNLAIIRVLIVQSTEEVVLSRLCELHLASAIGAHFWNLSHLQDVSPTETTALSLYSHDVEQTLPEEMLARFLLQVVKITVTAIQNHAFLPSAIPDQINFVCQELAHLLLYITHMFQSGLFRRVAMACMSVVNEDTKSIAEINNCFIEIGIQYPTLTVQWCNVLILLNYDVLSFWEEMLHSSPSRKNNAQTSSCLEIVRKGGLILFCDYVCENLNDVEHLTWLIVNHVNELVQLCSEPPVQDLISAVHRNPAASGLFLQAILTRCDNLNKPFLQCQLLSCLEPSHPAQSGTLISLLVERLLRTPYVALARAAHSMACRRFEMLLAEPPDEGASQLPLSELDKLFRNLHSRQLTERHSHLVTLMRKFRCHAFPMAAPANLNIDGDQSTVHTVTADKAGFLSLVNEQCQLINCDRDQCARLLASLDYSDLMATMEHKDFNLLLLENALDLGAQLYLSQRKVCGTGTSEEDSPLSPQPHQKGGLALYSAARQILLRSVAHLVSLLPHPPQVYCTQPMRSLTSRELKYVHRLSTLFSDTSVWEMLHQVAPAVKSYLAVIGTRHSAFAEVPMEFISDLARFSVLMLEACHWSVHEGGRPSPHVLAMSLGVANEAIKNVQVAGVLGLSDHTNWVCSAVYGLYRIFEFVTTEESRFASSGGSQSSEDILIGLEDEQQHVAIACAKMRDLLVWRETMRENCVVPKCLSHYLGELVIGLARLPVLNSYSRIPPMATQMGWKPEMSKGTQRPVTPLPVELLQERDVLRQFIIRVNTLGWTSRQQFEETWMSLLSVLSAVPVGDSLSHEEEVECAHTASLAIKCITSLLLQTMRLPQPGNPHNSPYLCQPRYKPLAYVYTRLGKRFLLPWSALQAKRKEFLKLGQWSNDVKSNAHQVASVEIDKCSRSASFGLGQVSLEYLQAAVGMTTSPAKNAENLGMASHTAPASYEQRERILSSTGLDLHSCLHFLLDLYSQWMANSVTSPTASLLLLTEATRSVVLLSDVFTERSQFQWMLDMLLELQRTHPAEDEVLAQYLTLGILKTASVLGLDGDLPGQITKIVEQSLQSSYLPTKVAALFGSLYVLETGHSETILPLISTLSEFCLRHLETLPRNVTENEELTLATWYVLFYILENHKDDLPDGNLTSRAVQISLQLLTFTGQKVSMVVEESIVHSLERLVLGGAVVDKDVSSILKLAVERSRHANPLESFLSMSLMLACMYLGKDHEDTKAEPSLDRQSEEADSEALIATMERFTLLFDRTKKGYFIEAATITSLFTTLLTEYFPLSDVMNKVIGEFISSQQPHPHMFAAVIFHVCEWASRQDQSPMVREWVLLSLSNFTQQSPLSMAIWSLTCVFVSASDNFWLRAMFPFVQQRIGKLEELDKQLFCLCAQDFFKQLSTSSEVEAFLATISAVARNDTPYMELLKMLRG